MSNPFMYSFLLMRLSPSSSRALNKSKTVQSAKAVLCAGELEPAGQLLQLVEPAEFLYLPATHAVHVPPLAPDQPALQAQYVISMLAIGECEFVGQALQLPVPAELLNLPAPHAVHAPPSSPE
jgi:hypothetical protein